MSSPSGNISLPASEAAASPPAPSIPDFELLRRIGRGSYGEVWLARGVTGVFRAIKIVWRERFSDAEPFEREFRGLKEFAAFSLGETTQLALLHVGRNEAAGFFYYVMELADDAERGRAIDPEEYIPLTLAEARHRRGRVPVDECVQCGVALARALAALHQRGLVHRDIKPSNVIVVNGRPKLADIGLVTPTASARTYVGTEGYVPPEGPGLPGADVYALGKVLYEIATGLDRGMFPKLPDELETEPDWRALLACNEIILRACEPRADRRYRDAAALLDDLERLSSGRPVRRLSRGWKAAMLAGLAVTGAVGGILLWSSAEGSSAAEAATVPPAAQSVAVLPFANLSGDPAQDYFSDGLSEEILNALARERDLRVLGLSTSFSLRDRSFSSAEIARTLNVAQLVEGSVRRIGNRVRIHIRLTRMADGITEHLGSFDREMADIFVLQDEIARAVVERIVHRTAEHAVAVATRNPAAYDAFLRGRALQVRASANSAAAATLYEQAVQLDPGFAVAWARLAEARFRRYRAKSDTSPAVLESTRQALGHALALAPEMPLALVVRSSVRAFADRDFDGAARDLAAAEALAGPTAESRMNRVMIAWEAGERKAMPLLVREAVAADPENGDRANTLAIILGSCGEFNEADRLYQRAVVIAGPGQTTAATNRAYLRRTWRGGEAALRLLARMPANSTGTEAVHAEVLLGLGRNAEARAILERVEAGRVSVLVLADVGLVERARAEAEVLRRTAQSEFDRGNRSASMRLRWIGAEIVLGRRDSALAELEAWRQEEERTPLRVARRWSGLVSNMTPLYARLGLHEVVIARLRQAMADGVPLGFELRDNAVYAPLRTDPRFRELIKQAAARMAALPDPTDELLTTSGP